MSNQDSVPIILSIFMGVAVTISLGLLLNLPFWPWLFISILLILVVIAFISYITTNLSEENEKREFNFLTFLRMWSIALLTFLPFVIQKTFLKQPSDMQYSSLIKGPFSLSFVGLAIYSAILGISLIVLAIVEARDKKGYVTPLILGILFSIASVILFMLNIHS